MKEGGESEWNNIISCVHRYACRFIDLYVIYADACAYKKVGERGVCLFECE